MSQADELLTTLSVDYTDEPYITVNDDRTIIDSFVFFTHSALSMPSGSGV